MRTDASVSTPGASSDSRRVRASGSPVSPSRRTAARRTEGLESTSCRLASASVSALLTLESVSLATRWVSRSSCAGRALFCNCKAAARRSLVSAASNWWLASAVSTRPRSRLFRRNLRGSSGVGASAAAGAFASTAPYLSLFSIHARLLLSAATRPSRSASSSSMRSGTGLAAQASNSSACREELAAAKSPASLACAAKGSSRLMARIKR